MNSATQVQILNNAVSISHIANTLRKGMNPTILFPAIGKIVEQTGLFNQPKRRKTLNSNQLDST